MCGQPKSERYVQRVLTKPLQPQEIERVSFDDTVEELHRLQAAPRIRTLDDGTRLWLLRENPQTDSPSPEFSPNASPIFGPGEWYSHGKLHREDGPAVERPDGGRLWFDNGELHREDGPAVEHSNGVRHWFVSGKRHRADGPAIEHPDRDSLNEWWLEGRQIDRPWMA